MVDLTASIDGRKGPMMFRRRIVIEQTQTSGEPLNDFLVFISLTDQRVKHTARGGHVRNIEGSNIHFVDADGASMLPYEIETFDGVVGRLGAWVRLPTLSEGGDTVFYMVYGGEANNLPAAPTDVWDTPFVAMLRPGGDATNGDESQHEGLHHFDEQLMVEVWARGDDERAEVLQAIASKW